MTLKARHDARTKAFFLDEQSYFSLRGVTLNEVAIVFLFSRSDFCAKTSDVSHSINVTWIYQQDILFIILYLGTDIVCACP